MLRDRRLQLALATLLGLWLLVRPWLGLRHDGRLYAVQALHRLYPAQFQHDLYFLYGSQDAFTLFSPLYAQAIAVLGLERAACLLQALGSACWLAAAAWLLRCFLRGQAFWLGLACLVLLPSDYGPTPAVFTLGEPFPTPRLFAEACGMLALALTLRGRWPWGAAVLAVGVLLHPLMAHGVALVGLLYLVKGRGRAVALAATAGALLFGAAALLGIAPFNRLLLVMDEAWLAPVTAMAPMVTWEAWHASEWASRSAVAFSLVMAAAWLSEGWRARFYYCLALAGAIGLLASWLGTGAVHNLLLIQVQPWRVLWLVQLGSSMALAWLLASFWQRGRSYRLLLLAMVVGVLTRDYFGGALAALAGAGLCLLHRRPAAPDISARRYLLLLVLLLAPASQWLAQIVADALDAGALLSEVTLQPAWRTWCDALLVDGAAVLPGAASLLAVWHWAGCARRAPRTAAAMLAVAWLAAGLGWNAVRLAGAERISAPAQQAVRERFLPHIPPQAVVYWENDVRASWFLLRRASYASSVQLAGLAFNRGTALEGERRLARLRQLGMADGVREFDNARARARIAALPEPSLAGLRLACADPALDFVVLTRDLGAGVIADVPDAAHASHYFLYGCAQLRQPLAAIGGRR